MHLFSKLAIALFAGGAALAAYTYRKAPDSQEFSGWDFALMGGISTSALGVLAGVMALIVP